MQHFCLLGLYALFDNFEDLRADFIDLDGDQTIGKLMDSPNKLVSDKANEIKQLFLEP